MHILDKKDKAVFLPNIGSFKGYSKNMVTNIHK